MENLENNVSPQPEQPSRRRSRRQKNGGCAGTVVYVIAVLGISIVLSLVAIFVANDVFAFVADDAEIPITVSENTDVVSLSKQLDDAGILHYGSIFKMYISLTGKNSSVLAGTYTLNPNMDYGQIARALVSSEDAEVVELVIPEGYSVAQIGELMLEKHVCTEEALQKALGEYPFKHEFLKDRQPPKEGWLEGYLFPDTYQVFANNNAVEAVNKMLNNFGDNKYDDEIKAGAEQLGRPMHEIVTIASLIEREAQKDDEYARIAGVIYNRLNNAGQYPYLQVDASVLYGLGRTGGKLTQEDLDKDTPYNLYTRQGLPPGPICNPGYKSLYAATHPEEHGYYYYVAMPDGSHLFASSNDEQNNNIAISNQAQAQAAANQSNEGE